MRIFQIVMFFGTLAAYMASIITEVEIGGLFQVSSACNNLEDEEAYDQIINDDFPFNFIWGNILVWNAFMIIYGKRFNLGSSLGLRVISKVFTLSKVDIVLLLSQVGICILMGVWLTLSLVEIASWNNYSSETNFGECTAELTLAPKMAFAVPCCYIAWAVFLLGEWRFIHVLKRTKASEGNERLLESVNSE